MEKILISPAHYLLDINSQSEFYLASKIIYSLAEKNKEIEYHVLCGHCANKKVLSKNIIVYELFKDYNFSLSLKNRIIFYLWTLVKSIQLSFKNKFVKIWHILPNGRYSYNLFILFKIYKIFNIKECIIGPLQIFHKSKDYLVVNSGKLMVTREKNNIMFIMFRILSIFSKHYFNNFNKYIFISKSSKLDYINFSINNITDQNSKIIGIGIDNKKFVYKRKSFNKNIKFLYVGNFTQNKNIDKILLILVEYKKINKNFILDLVGDGQEMSYIRSLVKKLKLFLLSKNEGFPHTLLESWASGVLFIGSNIPAFENIVRHNHNGLIFDINENTQYNNIANIISSINQTQYNQIVYNAENDCRQYHWDNIINQYYEIISKEA